MNGLTMMPTRFSDVGQFLDAIAGPDWANEGDPYLLIDGARLPDMCTWLERQGATAEWVSLLGAPFGSSIFAFSPVLVRQATHSPDAFVHRLLNTPTGQRACTILVSPLPLRELADHLSEHLYIEDPDGTNWGLAYWDPVVLAPLTGARPATSSLVPGPILSPAQLASLLNGIAWWCFRNRDETPGAVRQTEALEKEPNRPFVLDQAQMNQLADIALPDQVLAVVREAMPRVAANCSEQTLSQIFCNAILESRRQGSDEFANYCAVAAEALANASVSGDPSPTRCN